MTEATVTTNLTEVLRKVDEFTGAVQSFDIANRQAAIQLYSFTIRNYEAQGGLIGGWAPLKPATVKAKLKKGYSPKILLRTGTMRQNFAQFSTKDEAGVGNRISYSIYHQEGTSRMPQRRLLPNDEEMRKIGLAVYGKHIELAARKLR